MLAMDEELRSMLEGLREEIAGVRQEMRGEFGSVREEMRGGFAAVREETRSEFAAVREENAAAHIETRQYVDTRVNNLRGEFEGFMDSLSNRFGLLGEAIASGNERLSREVSRLDEKMDRGFAETHELIRFTYAHLDRRVTKLEKARRKA